ncbi:MAG: hypothetical protein SGPRY_007320, partial [Prymnesium sp.]
ALAHSPSEHAGIKVWAILVGVVSMSCCAAYLFFDGAAAYAYVLAIGASSWWLQGIAISFVPNVYNGSVNGYVCTWLSIGLAGYYTSICSSSHDPNTHLCWLQAADLLPMRQPINEPHSL